jgi:hypothetical protein
MVLEKLLLGWNFRFFSESFAAGIWRTFTVRQVPRKSLQPKILNYTQ